jgi:hypothetical protein
MNELLLSPYSALPIYSSSAFILLHRRNNPYDLVFSIISRALLQSSQTRPNQEPWKATDCGRPRHLSTFSSSFLLFSFSLSIHHPPIITLLLVIITIHPTPIIISNRRQHGLFVFDPTVDAPAAPILPGAPFSPYRILGIS